MTEEQIEKELTKWLAVFGECRYPDKERLYEEFMAGRQSVIDAWESTQENRRKLAAKAAAA